MAQLFANAAGTLCWAPHPIRARWWPATIVLDEQCPPQVLQKRPSPSTVCVVFLGPAAAQSSSHDYAWLQPSDILQWTEETFQTHVGQAWPDEQTTFAFRQALEEARTTTESQQAQQLADYGAVCVSCGCPLSPDELQDAAAAGGRCGRCGGGPGTPDAVLATELQLRSCRPQRPRAAFEIFLEGAMQAAAQAQQGGVAAQQGAMVAMAGGAALVDPRAVAADARQQWQALADKSAYEQQAAQEEQVYAAAAPEYEQLFRQYLELCATAGHRPDAQLAPVGMLARISAGAPDRKSVV